MKNHLLIDLKVDAGTWTHLLIFFQDDTRDLNTHADTSTHTVAHPPLVIVELLLHQEQVGFELVPLENDVTHLLLGEARLVGILLVIRQLVRRLASFLMRPRLRGETNTKSNQAQTGGGQSGSHFQPWSFIPHTGPLEFTTCCIKIT